MPSNPEPRMTLYVKAGCPFCDLVIRTAADLGLEYERKDITQPGVAEELMARGGKRQMPYMVDALRGVEMYESEDIAAYLKEHYSVPA